MRKLLSWPLGLAAAFAGFSIPTGSAAQDKSTLEAQCTGAEVAENQQRIAACTQLIATGGYTSDNLSVLYGNLGLWRHNSGDDKAALEDLDRALGYDPTYAIGYENRGMTYIALGQTELGIADYGKAIALDPKLSNAYYDRGLAYGAVGVKQHLRGYLEKAIPDFSKAIALKSDDANYYRFRRLIYLELGEANLAQADYEQALRLDPRLKGVLDGDGPAAAKTEPARQP
jgi:tetratricopeptide (TPR) repeat protein